MSEKKQFIETFIRLSVVVVFGTLYCLGGWGEFLGGAKWLRRFVAPCVLGAGLFYFSRDWKSLLQVPLMFITLSLGYGGTDVEWIKILKRGIYGVANAISSGAYTIYQSIRNSHVWVAFSCHSIFVITSSILFGVYNPLADARVEEFTIGFIIAFIPMMTVRKN